MRRILVISVLAAMVAVGAAGTATAAKPTIERIAVDESFQDPGLSTACEFDVFARIVGTVIVRRFDGNGTGPVELRTVNQVVTFSAGDNAIRFRDVGADRVRINSDGTAILSLIGQLPLDFNGVLKINLDTGEFIHEPQFKVDAVAELCEALAA